MKNTRQHAETQGRRAERLAAWYLRLFGWKILAHRARVHCGEVDLIARKRGMVVFVEVKWRKKASDLDFAIDERRLVRVAAAAQVLANRYCRQGDSMRIDVLLLAPGCWPRHIRNAWMPYKD